MDVFITYDMYADVYVYMHIGTYVCKQGIAEEGQAKSRMATSWLAQRCFCCCYTVCSFEMTKGQGLGQGVFLRI